MSDELFDPADHKVEDVLDHLAQADAAEVARVLDAEGAGKARKGVLDWEAAEPEVPPTTEELLGDADPYELVRAKDQAGNEYTTSRVAALNARSTVLTKPATDAWGAPIPTKTFLDLRVEEAAAADGQPSQDSEE